MKFLLFISFSLIFALSSLSRVKGYESLVYAMYIILILLPILLMIFNKFRFRVKNSQFILVYFFVLFSVISSMFNGDLILFINSAILGTVFIVSICFLPIFKIDVNKIIISALIFTHIPIIVLPILLNGIVYSKYAGIFYNPNTFGNTSVTLFSVVFSVHLVLIQKNIEGVKQKNFAIKNIICTTTSVFLIFLVILSNSRTSFVSLSVIVLFGVIVLGFYLIKTKKIVSFVLKGSLFALLISFIIFVVIKSTNLYYYFYFNIVNKFIIKHQSGDVLDIRGQIWGKTLKDGVLFGNGSNYFNNHFEFGSHNTFIKFIGTVGYIPTFFLIVLLIIFLIIAMKHVFKPIDSLYKYAPFIFGINFLTLSLGEDMTFKLSMFMFLFSVGAILSKNSKLPILETQSNRNDQKTQIS